MLHRTLSAAEFAPALAKDGCDAALITYCRPASGSLADRAGRWAVIICPGGGYATIAPTEGEPVALAFLAHGAQAFVLAYSALPAAFPQQLLELASAVAWVRAHREELGVDRVAVCGFSAGGHLAGCLSGLWQDPVLSPLGLPAEQMRPDAAILCYPVISTKHFSDGRRALAGVDPSLPRYRCVDLDEGVGAQVPPTFLWCTCTDQMVPMENTLSYAAALRRAGVLFELHIFPSGPHAMSTATPESAMGPSYADSHIAQWLPLCVEWLKKEAGA